MASRIIPGTIAFRSLSPQPTFYQAHIRFLPPHGRFFVAVGVVGHIQQREYEGEELNSSSSRLLPTLPILVDNLRVSNIAIMVELVGAVRNDMLVGSDTNEITHTSSPCRGNQ